MGFRRLLLGYEKMAEYVPVAADRLMEETQLLLETPNGPTVVTANHVLLGYKPMITALFFHDDSPENHYLRKSDLVTLRLVSAGNHQSTLAVFSLRRISIHKVGSRTVCLFEGTYAKSYIVPGFYQVTNRLHRWWTNRKANNVRLPGNLHTQVTAMYILPRPISIVSVGAGDQYNMFPTDLHGSIGSGSYVDSLRVAGKACAQVDRYKKIVISEITPDGRQMAYDLGKNHMKEPVAADLLPISGFSSLLNLPLPKGVIRYYELQKISDVDYGIHRIHFFQQLNSATVDGRAPKLGTIHRHYAQWCVDHGRKELMHL